MSYQAIIRDNGGNLISDRTIGLRISILRGTATGSVVYSENHSTSTNTNGLLTLQIGTGNPEAGTFSAMNWAAGPYFVKTETDPNGGTNYSITGSSQLLSVPYALYAKTAENGAPGARGEDGESAYEIYVENNTGIDLNETDWLASLKGEDGKDGQGSGTGADGKSAYQIYLENNDGTDLNETEWLESLRGPQGETGAKGEIGERGEKGADGNPGIEGKSAYQIYVENNEGTNLSEMDWLTSLKGEDGKDGQGSGTGADGKSAYQIYAENNTDPDLNETEWLASLQGLQGETGTSAYQIYAKNNTDPDLSQTEWLASLQGPQGVLRAANSQGSYLTWNSTIEDWVVGDDELALGTDAGATEQGVSAVALGALAGNNSQGQFAVALGYGAGSTSQGDQALALGALAGGNSQGADAIALGRRAGSENQSTYAVAIGYLAGTTNQAENAVALGNRSGTTNQAKNAVAIGSFAGRTDQHEKSIVLNASGTTLDTQASEALYIAPIRATTNSSETTNLVYNPSTKEVSTDNAIADALVALQDKITALEAKVNQGPPSSFLRQAYVPNLTTFPDDGKVTIDLITATSADYESDEEFNLNQNYDIVIYELAIQDVQEGTLKADISIGEKKGYGREEITLDRPLVAYITNGPENPSSGVNVDVWIIAETLTSSPEIPEIKGFTTIKLSFGATKDWINKIWEENGGGYKGINHPAGIPLFIPVNNSIR